MGIQMDQDASPLTAEHHHRQDPARVVTVRLLALFGLARVILGLDLCHLTLGVEAYGTDVC
jgi:hypothetical protein